MPHKTHLNSEMLEYVQLLEEQGPAGLHFLNARVPHRFTGVYRLEAGIMYNVFLHDQEGVVIPEFLKAVPLGESFCQFVLRDGLFCTSNTAQDSRLDGHKYQGVLGAYYGVPLLNNVGGTLWHAVSFRQRPSQPRRRRVRRAAAGCQDTSQLLVACQRHWGVKRPRALARSEQCAQGRFSNGNKGAGLFAHYHAFTAWVCTAEPKHFAMRFSAGDGL